jgi:hypothetical protein
VDKRIVRLENVYGVSCTFRGQRRLSQDEVARDLFHLVSGGRSSDVLLRNGARLSLVVASHPEYTTPDCDSVPDLIAHDKGHLAVPAETPDGEDGARGGPESQVGQVPGREGAHRVRVLQHLGERLDRERGHQA